MDLVSKIQKIQEAGEGSYSASQNLFLKDVIKQHLVASSSKSHETYRQKHGNDKNYTPNISARVWFHGAQTTFREEYDKLGEEEFLVQEGITELIGEVNGDLEYRIELLDKAVLKALKIYSAKFLKDQKHYHGNIIHLNMNWVNTLKRLEAVEGPYEVIQIKKKDSFWRNKERYERCRDAAVKIAKGKGHDVYVIDNEEETDKKELALTFSFYKVKPWLETWAL